MPPLHDGDIFRSIRRAGFNRDCALDYLANRKSRHDIRHGGGVRRRERHILAPAFAQSRLAVRRDAIVNLRFVKAC